MNTNEIKGKKRLLTRFELKDCKNGWSYISHDSFCQGDEEKRPTVDYGMISESSMRPNTMSEHKAIISWSLRHPLTMRPSETPIDKRLVRTYRLIMGNWQSPRGSQLPVSRVRHLAIHQSSSLGVLPIEI